MTKNCPNCGKQVPDNAKFCMDCGHSFEDKGNTSFNLFSNGKIFLVIIAIVVIIGLIVIANTGSNPNNKSVEVDDVDHVDLTITDVSGWDSDEDKKSYTLYTEALFNNVPNDLKGYNVKTTYFDSNDSKIGYETEKLDNIYYDSEYGITFGYYTTYKMPDPDYVKVEIIKGGKVIDTFTEKIDKDKIDYLN